MAASSTSVMSFPSRFYLLADNQKFVTRSESQHSGYNKYYAQCKGNSAEAPQNVFEVESSHPDSNNMSVTWKHVEAGYSVLLSKVLWMLDSSVNWTTYFRLDAVDVKNHRAAIYVTLDPTGSYGRSPDAYLVRQDTNYGGFLADALMPTAGTISQATIFTVYDSALKKVWKEVVFDFDKAKVEDLKPFSTSQHSFDNSDYDHTVVFKPSLKYSQTIDSNWSSSSTFGFAESISVKGKIPFVGETEVGFTAEQSFATTKGGGSQISTENSVEVEVPVPPFRKVQVLVIGITGKVTIPFHHKEIATYTGGSVRERILYDGVCASVSSTGTSWKARYIDADGRVIDSGDDGFVMASGELPKLI